MNVTLKAARVNVGMTQEEVAEKLDVSRNTVSLWESGKVKLKPITLIALSSIYSTSIDNFILPQTSQNANLTMESDKNGIKYERCIA